MNNSYLFIKSVPPGFLLVNILLAVSLSCLRLNRWMSKGKFWCFLPFIFVELNLVILLNYPNLFATSLLLFNAIVSAENIHLQCNFWRQLLTKLTKVCFHLVGFRTCYPKQWKLGMLNILNWRTLRKGQKQEGHFDLPPSSSPLFPEIDHETPI